MMKNIIIATDFSDVAKNAAVYALHLAKYLETSLELVHAYEVPYNFSDTGIQYIDFEQVEQNARESLKDEAQRLQDLDASVSVMYSSCVGRITDCLLDLSEEKKPIMIVFGMSGASDSFLWGSMAIAALRSFYVPVLIVPRNAHWQGVKDICYAVNYEKLNENTPHTRVKEWCEKLNGLLTIFNVHPPGKKSQPPEALKAAFEEKDVRYISFEASDFESGIQNFLSNHQFDWLVIIPLKHGFFDRLLNSSRSKQITKVSSIPVLSFYNE